MRRWLGGEVSDGLGQGLLRQESLGKTMVSFLNLLICMLGWSHSLPGRAAFPISGRSEGKKGEQLIRWHLKVTSGQPILHRFWEQLLVPDLLPSPRTTWGKGSSHPVLSALKQVSAAFLDTCPSKGSWETLC